MPASTHGHGGTAAAGGLEDGAPAPVPGRAGPGRPAAWRRAAAALAAVVVVVAMVLLITSPGGTGPASPAGAAGLLGSTARWSVAQELHSPGPAPSPIEIGSIACTAAGGTCVGVGGPYLARRNGAGRWAVRGAPAGVGFLTSVACAGGHCVAVAQPAGGAAGSLVIWSADAGADWSTGRVPAGVGGLSAVSCSGPARCLAVGESRGGAVAIWTSDGGASWHLLPVPGTLAGLEGVGCSPGAGGICVAVGWEPDHRGAALWVLGADGTTWSALPAPPGIGALSTVACPTAQVCYAGGFLSPAGPSGVVPVRRFPGALAATVDGGRTWHLLALPAVAGPVNAVSCPEAMACVAAGVGADAAARTSARAAGPPGMALSTVDGGRHWQVDALPPQASGLAGVSCVAAAAPVCTAIAAGPASTSLVLAGSNAG